MVVAYAHNHVKAVEIMHTVMNKLKSLQNRSQIGCTHLDVTQI